MSSKDDSDFHVPNVNLAHFMIESMGKYGDTIALVDPTTENSYTYAEVIDRVQRLAAGLRGLGLHHGDVLCIMMHNDIDFPIITYATNLIGGIIQTLAPDDPDHDIIQRFHDCKTRFMVTSQELADKADRIINSFKASNKEDGLRNNIIVMGQYKGFIEYNSLFGTDRVTESACIDPKTTAAILLYSSGTTGMPKNVQLSHTNTVANLPQMLYVYRHHPGMCTIGVQGMFHHYGNCGVMNTCLYSGVKLVVMKKYNTEDYIRLIEKYKADVLQFIPPISLRLTKSPLRTSADLSSVKFIHSAAAALGNELTQELMKMFNLTFISQMYGLSETGLITGCYEGAFKLGSSGVLTIGTRLKIVNIDTREEVPANERGEILCKGPQVTIGYLNNQEVTQSAFDKDGFFKTGDIGYVDDDGFLFVVDRIKDMIKYGGKQVPPAYLEDIIVKHPGVFDAAVVGVPVSGGDELPKAFIVRCQDYNVTEEDIKQHVQELVPDYMKLRGGVEFVQQIPKGPSGKILRRLLK